MDDEKLKKVKEYLKLRKMEKEDNSMEMITEIYEKNVNHHDEVDKDE